MTTPHSKFSRTDWLILALVWVGYYLLDRLTFYCGDDMDYSFVTHSDGSLERITTFAQVWAMEWSEYMVHTGRFIVHTFAQLFLNFWGVTAFEIVNAFVFTAFYAGMLKLVRRHLPKTPCDHLILILLLASITQVGAIFLGIAAYVVNYLWPACGMVWFLVMLDSARRPGWLIALAAAFIGALQESFSLPISGALFVYYCFHFKQFRGPKLWAVIGFWIGTAFVSFAPGNFVRLFVGFKVTNPQEFSSIIKFLQTIYAQFMFSIPLMVLTMALIIQVCFDRKGFRDFMRQNQMLLYVVGFCLFLGCIIITGSRQMTCCNVAVIIMLMRLIYRYLGVLLARRRVAVNIVLFAIFAVGYVFVYKDRAKLERLFEAYFTSPTIDEAIVAPEFIEETLNQIANPFSMNFIAADFFDHSAFWFANVSKFREVELGLEPAQALLPMTPTQLVESYKGGTMRLGDYIYIIASENPDARVYMHSTPRTAVARLMLRLLRPGEEKIDDVTDRCQIITIDGTTYFVCYNSMRKISGLSVE